jgi:hypothetical protein
MHKNYIAPIGKHGILRSLLILLKLIIIFQDYKSYKVK